MRKYSKCTPPDITTKEQSLTEQIITIEKKYVLLTPLCGGGVEPFTHDPVTIIRAPEIRGHLRFWWRACRGKQYSTLQQLKKAEGAIWGKAHKKGDKDTLKHHQTVQITVEVTNKGQAVHPFIIVKNRTGTKYVSEPAWDTFIHPYASFPLKPPENYLNKIPLHNPSPDLLSTPAVYANVCFTLTITFPTKNKPEIDAALWAWETFGGIGARTRRGFGAISHSDPTSADLPATANKSDIEKWLELHLNNTKYVADGTPPKGVPYLSKQRHFSIAITTTNNNPILAWRNLIDKLSFFRQAPDGRYAQKNDNRRYDGPKLYRRWDYYGHSYWPEAEAIREITAHPDVARKASQHHLHKFPRAAFGLPIQFHFPKEKNLEQRKPTLQVNEPKSDRLASPIILRPLRCRNKQTVGIALLLDGYTFPESGVILAVKGEARYNKLKEEDTKHPVDTQLTPEDLTLLPNLKLNGQTDVLLAFMNYIEGK